jgi:hypothetical protein
MNLVGASQSRQRAANTIAALYDKVTTDEAALIVLQLCEYVVREYRRGENVSIIETVHDAAPIQFKVEPLILEDNINILYGNSEGFKSTIAGLLLTLIQLPWEDNGLGLKPKYGKVLYLDYEGGADAIHRTVKGIVKGAKLPDFTFHYRYCHVPLQHEMETIARMIKESHIDTLIIDPLAQAAGGDLNNPSTASSFFGALRSLKVTTIIIHHGTKAQLLKREKDTSPYGTVYFINIPRLIWEIKKSDDTETPNEADLLLINRKSNLTQKHKPISFHILFNDDGSIKIARQEAGAISEFRKDLSVAGQIIEALKDATYNKLTTKELADTLKISDGVIRVKCNKLRERGVVVKLDHVTWGLAIPVSML